MLPRSKSAAPPRSWDLKIISVCVCACVCLGMSLGVCVCSCASFFKSTTAHRHLNLPTWQLAPLITKSNTHQWMSNEAFLRELWVTVGLGSTPRVWISYYVLLRHSVKYTEEWMSLAMVEILPKTVWSQINSFNETVQISGRCCQLDSSHKLLSCDDEVQKAHSELSIQGKLALNKEAEGESLLNTIVLHSPCLTLEAHTHSW